MKQKWLTLCTLQGTTGLYRSPLLKNPLQAPIYPHTDAISTRETLLTSGSGFPEQLGFESFGGA